jgi:hypothetical protein
MVLNLLGFVRIGFVGKLTKWMNGYNKQGHWSNVDGEERLIFKFSIRLSISFARFKADSKP